MLLPLRQLRPFTRDGHYGRMVKAESRTPPGEVVGPEFDSDQSGPSLNLLSCNRDGL